MRCNIYTNECLATVNAEGLRPDLVIENVETKKVLILDVAITAQSGMEGRYLEVSRQRKKDKYQDIENQYRTLGYEVLNDALVFGDLGGTDERNHQLLKMFCTGNRPNSIRSASRYAFNMHRFIVVSILRSAYSIWVQRSRPRQ